jgi:hypothetical protein
LKVKNVQRRQQLIELVDKHPHAPDVPQTACVGRISHVISHHLAKVHLPHPENIYGASQYYFPSDSSLVKNGGPPFLVRRVFTKQCFPSTAPKNRLFFLHIHIKKEVCSPQVYSTCK